MKNSLAATMICAFILFGVVDSFAVVTQQELDAISAMVDSPEGEERENPSPNEKSHHKDVVDKTPVQKEDEKSVVEKEIVTPRKPALFATEEKKDIFLRQDDSSLEEYHSNYQLLLEIKQFEQRMKEVFPEDHSSLSKEEK